MKNTQEIPTVNLEDWLETYGLQLTQMDANDVQEFFASEVNAITRIVYRAPRAN